MSTPAGSGIQVSVRVRPPTAATKGTTVPWKWNAKTVTLPPGANQSEGGKSGGAAAATATEFSVNKVFHPDQSTLSCYDQVCRPLVRSFLQGYDACIFAYGQTGSGKTHTICGGDAVLHSAASAASAAAEGKENSIILQGGGSAAPGEGHEHELGFLPLAVTDIFRYMQEQESNGEGPQQRCVLRAAFIELYNENLRDLLAPDTPSLVVAEDQLHGVHLPNLECRVVSSMEEVMSMVKEGQRRRVVGVNSVHEHSSRSHTIFQLTFESRTANGSGKIVQSVFNVIDLAGSETNYQTPTDHQEVLAERALLGDLANIRRLEESKKTVSKKAMEGANIRKSLLALIRCVDSLSQQQQQQTTSTPPAPGTNSRRGSNPDAGGVSKGGIVVPQHQDPDASAADINPNLSSRAAAGSSAQLLALSRKKSVGFGSSMAPPPPPSSSGPNSSGSAFFVPFRDSKLTRLLRSALSGNSHAAILCTINPNEVKETMNTLRFATKAQSIHKGPRSVVVVDEQGTVLAKLEEELERVRHDMSHAAQANTRLLELEKTRSHSLAEEKALVEREAQLLQARCANLERLFLSDGSNPQRQSERGRPSAANFLTSKRAPSAPAATNGERKEERYYNQVRKLNREAILATQDQLVKEMLQSQRSQIEALEQKVSDLESGSRKIANDAETMLKERVKLLEAENKDLKEKSEAYRKKAINLAGLYEMESETLATGVPSGFCGAAVKVRRAPRPTMVELFERYPELKPDD